MLNVTSAVLEGISSGLMQATGRNVAFGGMAVVFFGDLGQLLPPKSKYYIWKSRLFLHGYKYSLTEAMRHIEDEDLHDILQLVRKCRVDENMKVAKFIKQHCRESPPTRNANKEIIDLLHGPLESYVAIDYPSQSSAAVAALNFETNLAEQLHLQVGAQVMIVRNLDVEHGWSNGALAEVVNMADDVIELVHLDNGSIKLVRRMQEYVVGTYYSRRQFPIVLAYAPTIHKVQSLTLPRAVICFDDMPSHCELYVAMSRVRHGDELRFFGVNAADVEERFQLYLNCDAIEIMEKLD